MCNYIYINMLVDHRRFQLLRVFAVVAHVPVRRYERPIIEGFRVYGGLNRQLPHVNT